MNPVINVYKLGRTSFNNALKIQNGIAQAHLKGMKENRNTSANTLLLLEHHPVYTIGIRSKEYTEKDANKLKSLGADFVQTNRGGLITFHGPGQLVAYPIINLKHFKPSMKWYVCQLEQCVIKLCKKFNIKATTSPHTGVWVGDEKIAAIGIHGSRYITTHGIAINCNTDLMWFQHITPCGIPDKGVTSLSAQLQRSVSVSDTIPQFLDAFQMQFDCSINIQDEETLPKLIENYN